MPLTTKLRSEAAYIAILALLALQALPTASAQLSGNVLYVYDKDPNSSNYYAYGNLGNIGAGQTGWINVSADVWLASYSGPGTVAMLRISIGSYTDQFAEFACINGTVYARIVAGSNNVNTSIGPLATGRYYPLRIEMHIVGRGQRGGIIDIVNFYVYDGAGNTVFSWPWSGSLGISLPGNAYIVFGSPSEPNGRLQYDLYVDNIAISSNIGGLSTGSINFDTTRGNFDGSGYTTITVTTVPGYPPQPIPEPWIAGVFVLAASSAYLLIKRGRAQR